MSMQDPISDMLAIIRNGQMAKKKTVRCPASKKKAAILQVLKEEGYILGFELETSAKPSIVVFLKYHKNKPVIESMSRVSRPGLRIHRRKAELPRVLGGLGISIVSTSKGVMSDKKARKLNQGGELLCTVA